MNVSVSIATVPVAAVDTGDIVIAVVAVAIFVYVAAPDLYLTNV